MAFLHRLGEVERSRRLVHGRHVVKAWRAAVQGPASADRFGHVVVERGREVQGSPLNGGKVPERSAAPLLGVHGSRQLFRIVAGLVESGTLALVAALVLVKHVHLVFPAR